MGFAYDVSEDKASTVICSLEHFQHIGLFDMNSTKLFDKCLQMYRYTSTTKVLRKFRGGIPRKKFMNHS